MKIGIIGQGFVGTAVREGLKDYHTINTFDLVQDCSCDTVGELIDNSNIIFVCVPTPMKKDGSCDTRIVEGVVKDINNVCNVRKYKNKIIAIKSTIPPGTTNILNKENEYISVIFNPEFLTEANFIEDFKNQTRIILGGTRKGTNVLRQVYSKVFPTAHIIKTGSITAEMVKYMTNAYLATKVSFSNEIKQICDKLDIDYDKVVEYAILDERLGKTHLGVPGPDGDCGFGGHCLPKDINALISVAHELGIQTEVLEAVVETNDKVRENRDWEEMKGRAVV